MTNRIFSLPRSGMLLTGSVAAALAVLVLGCAIAPASNSPVENRDNLLSGCDAKRTQNLVGRTINEDEAREALGLSGAEIVRWIAPGKPISHDYHTGRLNIETDGTRIVRIYCG